DSRADIQQRLYHEMRVIAQTGFINYFLVVWDIVRFARSKGIAIGPGRGSAAGSIVSYCLGITDIDPLKYGLLFERFLNPERVSIPDIDIDFSPSRREEIISYLREKYGADCVAQLITFGTLQARAVIRDVARVLDIPLPEADAIAKRIPKGSTLEDALKEDPSLSSLSADETYNRLFSISKKLEGLCRHASTHAAGVVISDRPLVEYCPLYRVDGETTTQYPMGALEAIGLMKMDLLGLITLDVIEWTKKSLGNDPVPQKTDEFTDKKTYALLQKGDTEGVFQLESEGMKSLLVRVKPTRFEDLIDILALFRPGPLGSGMVDSYVKNRKDRGRIEYVHPALKEILDSTYGVILYQEQVMQMANVLAGFSLTEADQLRKAMGKKKVEIAEEYRERFIKGALQKGISYETAEKIYSQMAEFAHYGFNKSHSAAYAVLAYRTAYLKANFPRHFAAALLTSEENNTDKLYKYIEDCRKNGIEILPPDINRSAPYFKVEGDAIRYGLTAIKGVSNRTAEEIVSKREKGGNYSSLFDLCERLDVRTHDKKTFESLIKAGALDSLGGNRLQLLESIERAMESGARRQRDIEKGQSVLFSSPPSLQKSPQEEPLPSLHLSEMQLLAMEKEVLGFYLSSHPLMRFKELISIFSNSTVSELRGKKENEPVVLGAIIENISKRRSKKGDTYFQLSISDMSGTCDCIVFSRTIENIESFLKKDSALFILGSVDNKRERPMLIVNDMVPFEQASNKLSGEIRLRIEPDEETLLQLKRLFEKYPGKTRVKILVSDGEREAILRLPQRIGITPSDDCLRELRALSTISIV
ncbi:MAG: DNA polymerase III subunit alpha, partial [Planctomycetota bacterium]|nr:DNA polymerase III subunit alpha [Planctomycetota bacterium]